VKGAISSAARVAVPSPAAIVEASCARAGPVRSSSTEAWPLPLPEVTDGGLSENRGIAREIEHVIDDLKREPDVQAV